MCRYSDRIGDCTSNAGYIRQHLEASSKAFVAMSGGGSRWQVCVGESCLQFYCLQMVAPARMTRMPQNATIRPAQPGPATAARPMPAWPRPYSDAGGRGRPPGRARCSNGPQGAARTSQSQSESILQEEVHWPGDGRRTQPGRARAPRNRGLHPRVQSA